MGIKQDFTKMWKRQSNRPSRSLPDDLNLATAYHPCNTFPLHSLNHDWLASEFVRCLSYMLVCWKSREVKEFKVAGPTFEQIMWKWAWESACPKEWGYRKKAQDLVQPYKINGSTNDFENKHIASSKVKDYDCEKITGWFDSGVEKLAAQNVASQGPVLLRLRGIPGGHTWLCMRVRGQCSGAGYNLVHEVASDDWVRGSCQESP